MDSPIKWWQEHPARGEDQDAVYEVFDTNQWPPGFKISLSSLSGHWFSSFFADLVTNFLIGPVNVGVPWCLDDLSPWLLLIYVPSLKEPNMFKCQICADCAQINISSPDFSPEPQTWMSSHLSEHFSWMTQTAWPVEIKTFLSTSQSCTSSSLVFFFFKLDN